MESFSDVQLDFFLNFSAIGNIPVVPLMPMQKKPKRKSHHSLRTRRIDDVSPGGKRQSDRLP